MRVTVLGSGAAYPRAGAACSGYVVRSDSTAVLVDAGNGTLSNLQRHMSQRDIDGVVLSHAHADHIADAIPLMYALGYDDAFEGPLRVHATGEVPVRLRGGLGEGSEDMFERVYSFTDLGGVFEVGDIRFEPFETVHPVLTYGFRITTAGATVVYTADTAWFEGLERACHGADLLICEATFVRPLQAEPGIHLWADEAGRVARRAETPRLVLTHVWPTTPLHTAVEQAAANFDGDVEAAVEGREYTL